MKRDMADRDDLKVLFVLNATLGWKTYASQLSAVIAEKNNPNLKTFIFIPSWTQRTLAKRHNQNLKIPGLWSVDPIHLFRGLDGRSLRKVIWKVEPDVIHFGPHWPGASHAFSGSEIPFTLAMDSTRPAMERLREQNLWTQVEKEAEGDLLRRANRLFPWSTWNAASLETDFGVLSDQIGVIPPSIDMRGAEPPRHKRNDGRLPRIAFVGNDFLRKGGDLLHRWVTGPLRGTCDLHIVSHDPRGQQLTGTHVFCHSGMSHGTLMNEFMPSMDLICHPTQSDMSAYVLVEAARAGLPCVASCVGGIPDLVRPGETGYLVDRRDEIGFVAHLRELISSQNLRNVMGAAAHRFAAAHFSAHENYSRMLDEILSIAEEARLPNLERRRGARPQG